MYACYSVHVITNPEHHWEQVLTQRVDFGRILERYQKFVRCKMSDVLRSASFISPITSMENKLTEIISEKLLRVFLGEMGMRDDQNDRALADIWDQLLAFARSNPMDRIELTHVQQILLPKEDYNWKFLFDIVEDAAETYVARLSEDKLHAIDPEYEDSEQVGSEIAWYGMQKTDA